MEFCKRRQSCDTNILHILCVQCWALMAFRGHQWLDGEQLRKLCSKQANWGGRQGERGLPFVQLFLGGLTFLYLYLLLVTVFALVLVLHMKYAALHYRRKNIGQQGLGRGVGESSFVFASLPGIANPPPSSFLISYFYFVFCICVLYFDMLPSSSLARVAYSCTNYERSYKFQGGFQGTILNVAIC